MLFQTRFLPGIVAGKTRVTYRTWQRAQVVVGNTYRLAGTPGALRVTAVEEVPIESIKPADARKAGFADVDELVAILRKSAKKRLTARSKVFRVTFRYVAEADPRIALRQDASAGAITEVIERLQNMDQRSRRGAWTEEVLQLIADRPKTRAPDLAATVGRETTKFKADVRKLKGLGLTISHDVGYELSKRGKATLKRLRGRR